MELSNTAPHTRAGSSPCVRRVLRKSGSLCAQPGGQGPQRPHWNRGGASAGARCWHREGVVDIVRGLSTTPRGGYWRREGAVDIVRGLSTPRGGYNARRCQQRASVRTTRAHANNSRRRSSARQRAAPIAPIGTSSRQHRQRSPPRTGRTGTAARAGPPRPMSHTREGIRKHSAAHKGRIKSLCAAHVA